MARPRKISDEDAVRLVDSLYEECGDCSRLKFSELEKHAVSLNMAVKAYDLRRHKAVLRRIAEIEALALNANSITALAYKGLDIDGFVQTNRTPDRLRCSLAELDARWHKLYNYAATLSKEASVQSDKLKKSEILIGDLDARNEELSEKVVIGHKEIDALRTENIYLRKMVCKYLYPALADSILKSESAASVATEAAIKAMTDGDVPSSLSESVAVDCELRSQEDTLLERLRLQVLGDDYDA